MKTSKVDALIIGSGVGGLCVAARLVEKGMKVRVIEKLSYLGGRFSSKTIKGFNITTGAIMVPFGDGSDFQEAFDLINAPFNVRPPQAGFRYRLSHGEHEVPPGGGGGLLGMFQFAIKDTSQVKNLLTTFKRAATWWAPADNISFKEWLWQYTDQVEVHNMMQGFCGAFIGTSADEVPAGEFFRFLKAMGRGSRYGIAAHGNLEVMKSLAQGITALGSIVDTKTPCKNIIVEQGRVKGAIIEHEGIEEKVEADHVISNTGPSMTVKLAGKDNFDKSYLALLDAHPHVTPVFHVSIRSREPLHEFPGIFNFGNTKRLVFLECPTLTCPELALDGGHLTTTFSIAESSAGPIKRQETIREILQEIKDNFPAFENKPGSLLITAHHGEWPAMRRWPGYPMPTKTPIEQLFNVGDGCMPPGTVGIEACAVSARLVAEDIITKQ